MSGKVESIINLKTYRIVYFKMEKIGQVFDPTKVEGKVWLKEFVS